MWKFKQTTQFKKDFLLIWIDEENQIISLTRLGSHSELFGK